MPHLEKRLKAADFSTMPAQLMGFFNILKRALIHFALLALGGVKE